MFSSPEKLHMNCSHSRFALHPHPFSLRRLTTRFFQLGLCSLFLMGAAGAAEGIRSEPVPGHRPVQPGEHPRLLFRKTDLPEIRKRAKTPEGKRIVAQLKKALGGGEALPEHYHPSRMPYKDETSLPMGAYSISHAAGFGMLYQLTGDQNYADLGQKCLEIGFTGQRDRDSNARYSQTLIGEELRMGPSLAWTALGYDLLYDGLDPEFRKKVALHIQNYNMEAHDGRKLANFEKTGKWNKLTMEAQAMKPRYGPGSNHYANITGGNAFALMGIYGDPGTDTAKLDKYLERLHRNALSALGGFGPRGFFHEGQGPSHTAAYPSFMAYWAAMKNVKGLDYSNSDPLKWITLRWVGEVSQSKRGSPHYGVRHESMGVAYGGSDIKSSGTMNEGRFSQGFGVLPEKYHAAALWSYENYFASANGEEFAYDTSYYPHHAIQALVNWPIGVKPENPASLVPKAYVDDHFGHYVVRNGWHKDSKQDVVISIFTCVKGGTRVKPWKALPIKILANGRLVEIPTGWKEKATKPIAFETDQTSTSIATSGGTFGIDFSERSGANGVMVSTKKLDTGYNADILHQMVGKLTVITFSDNEQHPKAVAADGGVVVGALKITRSGDGFAFSTAGTANSEMVNAYEVKKIDPKMDAITDETLKHPGTPDALISFDYEDMRQEGDLSYFQESINGETRALVYNVRPEHLRPGVFGEAFPFRPKNDAPSILPAVDPAATAKELSRDPLLTDVKGIFSRVELPAGAPWQLNGSSQTITYWLKLNKPRDGYALIVEPYGSSYHFGFHPGPTLMAAGKLGGLAVSYPNDPGVWRHIAYVRDAERGIFSMYVDGEMLGRTRSRGTFEEVRPTYLGGRRGKGSALPSGAPVEGDMDEFAIYNRALTAGELMALYQSQQDAAQALSGLRPAKRPPTGYIDADVIIGVPPLAVNFSAKRSVDPASPGNPKLSYAWDFGDGNKAKGLEASHAFQKEGEYQVALTVTNQAGDSHTAYFPIRVTNRAPSAQIRLVSKQGSSVTLSAAESSDPDGKELTFSWDTPVGAKSGPEVNLKGLPAGSHEVACTVTDPEGASNTAFFTVSILDSEGFRLPENPKNVVSGLHMQEWEVFREPGPVRRDRTPNFRNPEYKKYFGYKRSGTVSEFSLNDIHGGKAYVGFTFAGYLDVPADGEYEVWLDGHNYIWLQIGNDPLVLAKGGVGGPQVGRVGAKGSEMLPKIKLRKGLHRIKASITMTRTSRNTTVNVPWMRLIFNNSQNSFVASQERLFRSPLPAEAAQLGMPQLSGPDLLSLGPTGESQATPVAGNQAPVVRIVAKELASALGTKAMQFKVEATDPDGDPLSWHWQGLEGQNHEDAPMVKHLYHSGSHQVSVVVSDGRGGETAAVHSFKVPELSEYGRGFGINFLGQIKRRTGEGWSDGVSAYPGETFGAVPMSNWLNASQSRDKFLIGPTQKIGHETIPSLRDGDGNLLQIQTEGSHIGGGQSLATLPSTTTADDRFMSMGASMGEKAAGLKISGIPYASWDVVIYFIGNSSGTVNPDAIWLDAVPEEGGKKKKKKKGASRPIADLKVTLNGQEKSFTAAGEKHPRWPGYYSLLDENDPQGNVIIWSGLSGSKLDFHIDGGGRVAGIQVLERK